MRECFGQSLVEGRRILLRCLVVFLVIHDYHNLLCRFLRPPPFLPSRSCAASRTEPVTLKRVLKDVHELVRARIVPRTRFPLGCSAEPVLDRDIVGLARAGREGRYEDVRHQRSGLARWW